MRETTQNIQGGCKDCSRGIMMVESCPYTVTVLEFGFLKIIIACTLLEWTEASFLKCRANCLNSRLLICVE
jgi:hypothetical protein